MSELEAGGDELRFEAERSRIGPGSQTGPRSESWPFPLVSVLQWELKLADESLFIDLSLNSKSLLVPSPRDVKFGLILIKLFLINYRLPF